MTDEVASIPVFADQQAQTLEWLAHTSCGNDRPQSFEDASFILCFLKVHLFQH